MAFYINPAKRFSDSITLTVAPVKNLKIQEKHCLYIRYILTAFSRLKMAKELYFMTGATHSQTYHMSTKMMRTRQMYFWHLWIFEGNEYFV